MKVVVYLADGFEEIEALAVVDILRRVDIKVDMVSITDSLNVVGAHNIQVKADKLVKDVNNNETSMIVLPGGMPGTLNLEASEELKRTIVDFNSNKKYIGAICAAPSVLGKMNILEGRKATCYPGFEKFLYGAEVINESVVCSDYIITSRGVGTAIKFALKLVEILKGAEVAAELEKQLQV